MSKTLESSAPARTRAVENPQDRQTANAIAAAAALAVTKRAEPAQNSAGSATRPPSILSALAAFGPTTKVAQPSVAVKSSNPVQASFSPVSSFNASGHVRNFSQPGKSSAASLAPPPPPKAAAEPSSVRLPSSPLPAPPADFDEPPTFALAQSLSQAQSMASASLLNSGASDVFQAASEKARYCVVLYRYRGSSAEFELDLMPSETILILDNSSSSSGWWRGRKMNGEEGFFPSNFVKMLE